MPSNFTSALDTVQPGDNRAEINVDSSIGDAAKALAGLGEAIGEIRDEGILDKAIVESSSVLSQVKDYQTEKRDLLLASSVADKDKLVEFERRLQSLRNGEVQGRMSPAAAMLQVRTLTRDFQIRYPHLADKFRELNKQAITGIEDIVTQTEAKDPDVQRQYDLIKNTPPGMTTREYSEQLGVENKLSVSKKALEASQLVGEQREPLMESIVDDYLVSTVVTMQNSMLQAYRSGELITEDELAEILPMAGNMVMTIDTLVQQQQIESGGKFDDAFRETMRNKVKAQMEPLIEMAKNLDSREKQIKFLELMDKEVRLKGNMQFYKDFGPLARLAEVPGGWEMVGELIKFGDLLKQGLPTLEKAAETDTRTAFLLDMYKSGQLPKWVGARNKQLAQGQTPDSSGNPQVDRVVASSNWSLVNSVQVPTEQREQMLGTILASDTGMFTDTYDRILRMPNVISMIKQSPSLKKALTEKLGRNAVGIFSTLPPEQKAIMVYNETSKKFEVSPEWKASQYKDADTAASYGADMTYAYPAMANAPSKVVDLIELMNKGMDTLRVTGIDPTKIANELVDVLQGKEPPKTEKAAVTMNDDEKETLYWNTFNEYFDTTNPMRPKLRQGKTAKQAEQALRDLGLN